MYGSLVKVKYYYIAIGIVIFITIISIVTIMSYGSNENVKIEEVLNELQNYNVSTEFAWPVPGFTRISSTYGPRNKPTAGASSFHYGIDIAAPTGSNLVSSISGKVVYLGFNRCKWIYNKN